MVTGTMPFKGSTVAALKKSILDGRFELPIHLSDDCMDMIKSILKRKASWRLTLNQVSLNFNISSIRKFTKIKALLIRANIILFNLIDQRVKMVARSQLALT